MGSHGGGHPSARRRHGDPGRRMARICSRMPRSGRSTRSRGFVLGVSRFIPYKRLDASSASARSSTAPVVIAGFGPLEKPAPGDRARTASVPVQVLTLPSDAMVRALMARASLFVFPPIEDFGIVAVEAMAAGTPVIAESGSAAPASRSRRASAAHCSIRAPPQETREAAEACLIARPAAHRRSRAALRRLRCSTRRCSGGSAGTSPDARTLTGPPRNGRRSRSDGLQCRRSPETHARIASTKT